MTQHQSMTVFAIKQKSTGYYLPTASGYQGRGGSWVEPTKGATPRLFAKVGTANGFLTTWLKGGVKVVHSRSYSEWGGDDDISLEHIPQPHRNGDDMEVVALALVEVPIPVKI